MVSWADAAGAIDAFMVITPDASRIIEDEMGSTPDEC
jgi:hypothetical protein